MARALRSFSIFSHTLDRVAFLSYLLGAVIPLLALAGVAHLYVLPELGEGPRAYGLLGFVVAIGALSLASFFVLRRVTRQTLARMDGDNRRLELLLEASTALSEAPHAGEVGRAAAGYAARITEARAAFVLLSDEKGGPPALVAATGREAERLYEALRTPLDSLARLCTSHDRPALVNDSKGAGGRGPATLTAAGAVPLKRADSPAGALLVVHTGGGRTFEPAQVGALSTLAGLASVALRNAQLHEAQKNFFAYTTDILVTALDVNLDLQSGHARRVAHFANVIARTLRLDEKRLERLHFAALLHDIGMLRIDPALRANQKACQRHPQLGFRMLERVKLWEDVAPMVLHHHEWWNGGGYPEGLAGEAIPLEARIIGLAEAFDTMTSRSSYKLPVPVDRALAEIRRCAGTQFDPEVARVFLELCERGDLDLD